MLSYIQKSADKGIAPLYIDHESIMLLLHQSAFFLASEGFEPSYVMMKTLCLNRLTIRPYIHKPSASIALASAGYKTATLLLC